MLLKMEQWNTIRNCFTQAEKDELNAAIQGETICPPGCCIAESLVTVGTMEKLKRALAGANQAAG